MLKSRHLVYQVKLNRKNLRKKRSLVLAASFQDNRGKLVAESPASLDYNATRDKTATAVTQCISCCQITTTNIGIFSFLRPDVGRPINTVKTILMGGKEEEKTTRMTFSRAHTSAKAADVANRYY